MKCVKRSIAGTLESSDVMVEIIPWDKPLKVNIVSDVDKQYGGQIRALVDNVIKDKNADQICVNITDKGALDFTIVARLKTALHRASQ